MFRRISIEMATPICKCEEQNLSWGLRYDATGHALVICCETCQVSLVIPYEEIKAYFRFEVPYPGKKEEPKKEEVKEGEAKIIPLFGEKDKTE